MSSVYILSAPLFGFLLQIFYFCRTFFESDLDGFDQKVVDFYIEDYRLWTWWTYSSSSEDSDDSSSSEDEDSSNDQNNDELSENESVFH